jgi:transmembrane sensor
LCLLLFLAPHAWQDWRSDAHTAVGQQRQQILPDGSELLLDTDSAVALDFSGGKREVELLRGALAVHVAKDPVHPFRVHCAGSEITAIGTRFLVTRHALDVELGVTEGRVAVRTVGGAAMSEVGAGEHATIDSNNGTLQAGTLTANADSWTRGILSIDHVPLRTAVATLSRYVPQHVMWRADAVADTPNTATLPLNDPQAAIDALALTQGLRVRRWPGLLWIEAK